MRADLFHDRIRTEIAERVGAHPQVPQNLIAQRAGVRPQRLNDYLHGRASLGAQTILRLLGVLGGEIREQPLVAWRDRVRV